MKLVTRKVTLVEVDNDKTGAQAREHRKAAGFSLRAVAKQIGVTAPYICDLENGHRAWNRAFLDRYFRAITELKVARIQAATKTNHSTPFLIGHK